METAFDQRRVAEELRLAQAQNERRSKEITSRVRRTVDDAKKLRSVSATPLTAVRLAASHRKAIREGDFSVFFLPFTVALAQDGFLDLIASIPLIGALIVAVPSAMIALYLFIFLWGRGTLKLRIIRSMLLLLNWFPVIGIIPFQTFCVWWAYRDAQKEYKIAKKAEEMAINELERDAYGEYYRG